jgi:hypothetical protein
LKDFALFVYWKTQQEVIIYYYSYTTDSLTATTTTTFTTTIYLPLMALETRGLLQLLSRYNSKKKFSICANIHLLHLLQLLVLRHTTDDMKWGVTAPLFSMSFHRYNNPFYYNNPGLEKHQDRGFLLIISRYNFKNAKVTYTSHIWFSSRIFTLSNRKRWLA